MASGMYVQSSGALLNCSVRKTLHSLTYMHDWLMFTEILEWLEAQLAGG